jgi:hypothetical protein
MRPIASATSAEMLPRHGRPLVSTCGWGYRPGGAKKYVEYLTTTIADYKAKHPAKETEKPAKTTDK